MNPESAAMFQKHSYSVSCRITRLLRRNALLGEEIIALSQPWVKAFTIR